MSVSLPRPSPKYDPVNEAQARAAIEIADKSNRKIGQDVEMGAQSIILRDSDGVRWKVTIDTSGNLGTTAA